MSEPTDREILWRDYALTAQLYQFYFEMALKTFTAYYAITGAIVSFCLSRPHGDFSRWALILPLAMSVSLTFIGAFASRLTRKLRTDVISLSKTLGVPPRDFSPLPYAVGAFAGFQLLCAIGIGWLLWRMSV